MSKIKSGQVDFKRLQGVARVEAMVYLRSGGMPLSGIAKKFGITKQGVSGALIRWAKHLNGSVGLPR
jgi:hypothetical protein